MNETARITAMISLIVALIVFVPLALALAETPQGYSAASQSSLIASPFLAQGAAGQGTPGVPNTGIDEATTPAPVSFLPAAVSAAILLTLIWLAALASFSAFASFGWWRYRRLLGYA